jgi:hypothetical protein
VGLEKYGPTFCLRRVDFASRNSQQSLILIDSLSVTL